VGAPRLPTTAFLRALEALDVDARLAAETSQLRDGRLTDSQWRGLLARELTLIRTWALGRLLLASRARSPLPGAPSRVYSFLPDHAVVVHVLRRAVPFAALGLPTWCGARAHARRTLAKAVDVLSEVLGLGRALRVLPMSCREAVATEGTTRRLLVVTGSTRTMPVIRRLWPGLFAGASGRCAVTLGGDASALYRACAPRHLPHSCSNVRASFELPGRYGLRSPARGLAGGARYDLAQIASRLHPSVVLVHRSALGDGQCPPFLAGYHLLACDSEGRTEPTAGFGADPRFGWPGDYLV
jgi:hypothetical protein